MYCDQRSQYVRLNSKKNSFHGNYSRKYGICNFAIKGATTHWKYVATLILVLKSSLDNNGKYVAMLSLVLKSSLDNNA